MNARVNSRKSGAAFIGFAVLAGSLFIGLVWLAVAELTKGKSAGAIEMGDVAQYKEAEDGYAGLIAPVGKKPRKNVMYGSHVREDAQLAVARAKELLAASSASPIAQQERESVDPELASLMQQMSQYDYDTGTGAVSDSTVPEPATMSILSLTALLMLRRPRKKLVA